MMQEKHSEIIIGTVLVDKKDSDIIAQVIDIYKHFFLVEVHAKAGNYVESVHMHDWKTGESRWRL